MKYDILKNTKKYIEAFLKIRTKDGKIQPFRLNMPQKRLLQIIEEEEQKGGPIYIVILKARQMGFSTLTEGVFFHRAATHANVNGMIITHKDEATTNLFNMTKLYYDSLPEPLRPMRKASNAKELIFDNPTRDQKEKDRHPGLRSRIKCATAGGKGVGRSETLTNIHASEMAFWTGDIQETMIGLMQALPSKPGCMMIVESTANGFNYFKKFWDDAVAGKSGFRAVFFPWFEMPDYRRAYHGETLTAEEQTLQRDFGLDNEQIMWRRWCIETNCGGSLDYFRQEYPATPEEAFIATGTCIFDTNAIISRLRALEGKSLWKEGSFSYEAERISFDAIRLKGRTFREEKNGEIRIYKEVEAGKPYVLGGDTAGEGSDYFTAQVVDNVTGEVVAVLKRQYDEDEYAKQIYCLGMYYNTALVSLEVNFSSHPIKVLELLGYPNLYVREVYDNYTGQLKKAFGWHTNSTTRPVLVATVQEYVRDNLYQIHDPDTLRECLTFIRNEKGRAEAEAGEHDDLIMALGIALCSRGQQCMQVEAEKTEKKTIWTADMWEDYRHASAQEKAYLVEKYGSPK